MTREIFWDNLHPEVVDKINNASVSSVRSVNNILPDESGNINTGFRIIESLPPEVGWNDPRFPEGISEFNYDYDPDEHQEYIDNNPSFGLIPKGKMMIRTYKDSISGVYWQYIDSTDNGEFFAQYIRMGNTDGSWGAVNETSAGHVVHLTDPPAPNDTLSAYPHGVVVFEGEYDENNRGWYDVVGLMSMEDYHAEKGVYPKGKYTVTSFRNKSLLNQTIQISDDLTGTVGLFSRFYDTKVTGTPQWVGGNSLHSGLDGRVRTVNGKLPKTDGSVSLVAGDINAYSKTETYNKTEVDSMISDVIPNIPDASTTQKGIVQLTNDTTGVSETLAVTQKGVSDVNIKVDDNTSRLDTLDQDLLDATGIIDNHIHKKVTKDDLGHVTIDDTTIRAVDGQLQVINPFTTENSTKLDGIEDDANNYTLPMATDTILGGVKVDDTSIVIDSNGVIRTALQPSPLVGSFTTTVVNTPYKHYKPSINVLPTDHLHVVYNGLHLREGVDWILEEIDEGAVHTIKLNIDQSQTDDSTNILHGTIHRGFGKIV